MNQVTSLQEKLTVFLAERFPQLKVNYDANYSDEDSDYSEGGSDQTVFLYLFINDETDAEISHVYVNFDRSYIDRSYIDIELIQKSQLYSGNQVMDMIDDIVIYIRSVTSFKIKLTNESSIKIDDVDIDLHLFQVFTSVSDFYTKFGYFPEAPTNSRSGGGNGNIGNGNIGNGNISNSSKLTDITNYRQRRQALIDSRVQMLIDRLQLILDQLQTQPVILYLFSRYMIYYIHHHLKCDRDKSHEVNEELEKRNGGGENMSAIFDSFIRAVTKLDYNVVSSEFLSGHRDRLNRIIDYLTPVADQQIGPTFKHLLNTDLLNFKQLILIDLAIYIRPFIYQGRHHYPFWFSRLLDKQYIKLLDIKP